MPDEPNLPQHAIWLTPQYQRVARASFDFFPDLFNGPGALYLSSKWARRGTDNFPLNNQPPP